MHTPLRRKPVRRVSTWPKAMPCAGAGPRRWRGGAVFLTARGHEQAGACAAAVDAYEQYRMLKTPLEPYARLREAAQQQALGRDADAAASYTAAAASDIARGERAGAYEKAIALHRKLGQNDIALQLYHKLLDAPTPDARA